MPSPRGHHDICIFNAGSQYRVRPAVWTSDAQKVTGSNNSTKPPEVTFRNLTDESVLLLFPAEMLYVAPTTPSGTGQPQPQSQSQSQIQSQSSQVALAPKRGSKNSTQDDVATVRLAAKDPGEVPGAYQYSVIVITAKGTTQAVGESEPVIIIDPPPV